MGHYYEPSASEGNVYREACHGAVGAKSDIYIPRGSKKILIASNYSSASSITITFQFGMTHSDHAHIRWNEMRLLNNNGDQLPFEITAKNGYNIPATRETIAHLDDGEITDIDGNKFQFYELTMTITGNIPNNFMLIVPSMNLNDIEYPNSNVQFEKAFGFWIFPINC